MNFRQFAINNVVRNKRIYLAHFLSSTFSVMIFFTYALLLFHPDLKDGLRGSSETVTVLANQGFMIAEFIIFIFSFLFLLYSVGFLKTRKKEFGIFLIIGMTREQMNRLLFMENMCIGIAAIAAGVGLGIIFGKLILLICGSLLAVENSLRFYFPLKAIALTAVAFLILFAVIALSSSLLIRKGTLIDLVKSEEKPKPEPKASRLLAFLSVLSIGGGYAGVFTFVWVTYSFPLLLGSVIMVIAGTYLLFTQLSVYVIRALKRNQRLFFRKTNVLFLSELTYRMKDNAVMFFMVSVISASAFTGIGTMLAIADPGLSSMTNPYAFTYTNSWNTPEAEGDIRKIEETLVDHGVPYVKGSYTQLYENNTGSNIIKLSEYNHLAKALGYEERTLDTENGAFMTPSNLTARKELRKQVEQGFSPTQVDLEVENYHQQVELSPPATEIVIPVDFKVDIYVISDELFEKMKRAYNEFLELSEDYYSNKVTQFVVEDWMGTRAFAPELVNSIQEQPRNEGYFMFSALVVDWLNSKQTNGIILILSGLIGIVFFTFAASFTYFRLYADLERDEAQYRMIGKMGLSRPELRKIVTQQLLLMFFLPLLIALIHSSVAFVALQQLVDFSVMGYSLRIFFVFASMQILYFALVRWRYLRHMYSKLI